MALTEQEKREFAERFKAELAEKYPTATPEPPPLPPPDPEAEREAELQKLKLAVQDEFYRTNNFVRHVDSKGQERWFSPDEYEERRKGRRKKRSENSPQKPSASLRRVALVAAGLVVAVMLGWLMSP